MRIYHWYRYLSVVVLVVLYTSCLDENSEPYVDAVFQPYVDQFLKEAAIRDLDLNPSKDELAIGFGLNDLEHDGLCKTSSRKILINEFYWNRYTELQKQRLIFHELGHCLLGRSHDNEVLPNGECKSLMKGSEENTCSSNLGNSKIWNKYYIDELFKEAQPLPNWYVTNFNKQISENIIDSTVVIHNYTRFDLSGVDTSQNFELAVAFLDWQPNTEIKLTIGNYHLMIYQNLVKLTNDQQKSIYLNKEWAVSESTKLTVAHYHGLDYILIDEKLFHIDKLDTDFEFAELATMDLYESKSIVAKFKLNILAD